MLPTFCDSLCPLAKLKTEDIKKIHAIDAKAHEVLKQTESEMKLNVQQVCHKVVLANYFSNIQYVMCC